MKLKQKVRLFLFGVVVLSLVSYHQIVQFFPSFGLSEPESSPLILVAIVLYAFLEEGLAEKIARKL